MAEIIEVILHRIGELIAIICRFNFSDIFNNHFVVFSNSDDEHSLIAQYCQSLTHPDSIIPRSPIQILHSIDSEQSEQLESVIRALEDENASLQAEYDRLKSKAGIENGVEARLLRQHKGRLEARMQILEDHNRELEVQLGKLRELLQEEVEGDMVKKTGTLQSKSVIAADLAIDSPVVTKRSSMNGGSENNGGNKDITRREN